MSFCCEFCGQQQHAGVKPKKIPTQIRMIIIGIIEEKDPETKLLRVYTRVREEIAQEKLACPACVKKPIDPEIIEFRDESEGQEEVRTSSRPFLFGEFIYFFECLVNNIF